MIKENNDFSKIITQLINSQDLKNLSKKMKKKDC